MKYYDRVCAVDISPDIRFEGLKIRFSIKKNIEPDRNTCTLTIYNISEFTRDRIATEKNALVRIQAGYSQNGGLVEICQSNISSIKHTVSIPDVLTIITCKDGFKQTRSNLISISFKEDAPLYTVIDTITKKINLPVRFTDYNRNAKLKGGFSFLGSVNDCLDILSQQFGFTWSIQDGKLQIIKEGGSTNRQIVLLSPETGLIKNPVEVVEDNKLQQPVKGLYELTSLLQPQLQVGDLVALDTRNFKGNFIVNELEHIGDTRGAEWFTKMRVVRNG